MSALRVSEPAPGLAWASAGMGGAVVRLLIAGLCLWALTAPIAFAAAARNQHSLEIDAGGGVDLAAVVTWPEASERPAPAVLFVNTFGPHIGSEARFGGAHWAALAERLAAHGLASLQLDNRGLDHRTVAERSEADYADYPYTLHELAADSRAALDWLRAHPDIDPDQVGLVSFSDGALRLGLIAETHAPDIAFAVLLSGSGVSFADNMVASAMQDAQPSDHSSAAEVEQNLAGALAAIAGPGPRASARAITEAALVSTGLPQAQATAIAAHLVTNTFASAGSRQVLGLDPTPGLAAMTFPVLTVNGAHDARLVHPRAATALPDALGSAGRSDVAHILLGGRSHFLEPVGIDDPGRFDGRVEALVVEWAERHTARD